MEEPSYVERVATPQPQVVPAPPPPPPTVNVTVNTPPAPQPAAAAQDDAGAAATTTITSADAGGVTWQTPLSGMAAHSTYDPNQSPVTPNAFGTELDASQVPRQGPDAGFAPDGGPPDGSAPAAAPGPLGAGSFMTQPPYNQASPLPTSPDPEAGAGPFILDRSTSW